MSNDTYLIQEGTEVDSGQNTNESTKNPKTATSSCVCKSKCLFIFSCLLTVAIIGGFSFLFGPLVLQRYFPMHKFTPNQITVQYYRLRLQPIEKSTTDNIIHQNTSSEAHDFKGRASIIFNNTQRTYELRLIAQDLTVDRINLTLRNQINVSQHQTLLPQPNLNEAGRRYHVGKASHIPIREYYQIFHETKKNVTELWLMFEKPLEIGNYMLDVYYFGDYHRWGLYESIYNDTNVKNDKIMQVEKSVAVLKHPSRVFPYFDNNQKIKFEVSIERKTDVQGFSNVAFREIEPIKNHTGYLWEHFKPTPDILPTSLGLIIADYKPINVTTTSPVVLKIFAPRKYHSQLTYAREVFPKIFEYFQEYFQQEYPESKLDIILLDDIIPLSSLSPMSSKPGLIVLNTNVLLLNSLSDNAENRWKIFSGISEAVALQFLQISMTEDNTELMPGCAKFLAYYSEVVFVEKDTKYWNSEEYFVENILEPSLNYELMGKIEENNGFKMSCVLRMIKETLNMNIFHFGMNNYLNSKDDFWQTAESIHLENNSTAKEYFQSWWENPGYPVVTITRTTGWNILISQKAHSPQKESNFVIALNYVSQNSSKVQHFILDRQQIETNLFVPQNEWLLFNYNRRGYYRVNYQLADWHKLIKQLELRPEPIPVINRAQLISDAFALADDGLLQFHIAFEAINYLRDGNERNYLPWWAAIGGLNRHEAVFLDASGDYGLFRKFKIHLLSQVWAISQKLDPKLAQLLDTELCKMQFKPCIKSALDFYTNSKHRKDVFIPQWVYCTVLMHSPDEEFDHVYEKLHNSVNHNEIVILLQSLTCTRVTYKLNSLLEESFENTMYAQYIWPMMSRSPMSRLLGLAFLEAEVSKRNENATKSEAAQVHEVWEIIIDEFLATMSTEANLYKILKIANDIPDSLQDKLKAAMKRINRTIQWTKLYYSTFVEQLSLKSY